MDDERDRAKLSDLLNNMKPKNKEPRSARVLESWIARAETEVDTEHHGRLSWLIATTIAAAKLQRVLDVDGTSRFSLKGGTLLQHRLGLAARASRDLDGIVKGDIKDFLVHLDEELRNPWGPIAFRRSEIEAIRVRARIVKPQRFTLSLLLQGKTWRNVPVEISPDEGGAGHAQEPFAAPSLAGFGLPTPDQLVGIAMSYQIAQKIHAASDPHDPPVFVNNRPRDVVDLILLKDLVKRRNAPSNDEIACAVEDIFQSRAKEARELGRPERMLPVTISALPHWHDAFEAAERSANLDLSLEEAVASVNAWLIELGVGGAVS